METDVSSSLQRIDYVIVLDSHIKNSGKYQYVVNFIQNLEEQLLTLEIQHSNDENNIYITVQLSDTAIEYFSHKFDVNINKSHTVIPSSTTNVNLKCFQTPLKDKDGFERIEGEVTTKERIMIAYHILNSTKFGENETDYGIEKLIRFEIAKTAYPLHDGNLTNYGITTGQPLVLTDRQLLSRYWANFAMWYKEQPLNLLEKYYGTDVAYYFAWLGFFNKMLIVPSAVGVLCFLISLISMIAVDHERVEDICNSKLIMCPPCISGRSCVYKPLNQSCQYAKISILIDNRLTVAFAVFMAFWGIVFVNLWYRFENVLKIRWNVEMQPFDVKFRTGFTDNCSHKRWNPMNDTLEPYVPTSQQVIHQILSIVVCIFVVLIFCLVVYAVIIYRVTIEIAIRLSNNSKIQIYAPLVLEFTSAWLQVLIIRIFGAFYAPLSLWLTNLENPRTQEEYDNSVIHKRCFLGFVNNYIGLFYIAFVKGRFYWPGTSETAVSYETDRCQPTGCLMSLCIHLSTMMLFKSLIGNILTLVIPVIKKKIRAVSTDQPQWEQEHKLVPSGYFYLIDEFLEMVIQYGFITFFVAGFPLAPLCALINNSLELRLDAYKFVKRFRRPVAAQKSGIGTWNRMLICLTHWGTAVNAFVIAFTSDFVPREYYSLIHGNSSFTKSLLSLFDMNDYKTGKEDHPNFNPNDNSTLCYYRGLTYPPDHHRKYQLTNEYWLLTAFRLGFVIVFQHVLFFSTNILSYFLPDMPETVRETLHMYKTKKLHLKYEQVLTAKERKWKKRK